MIWEDAGGARSCAGGNNFNGGTNACAGTAGGTGTIVPANAAALGLAQTVWDATFTLQYKPAPSLITRAEFRHDHSTKNVFLNGTEAANNQNTLAFQVIYLF